MKKQPRWLVWRYHSVWPFSIEIDNDWACGSLGLCVLCVPVLCVLTLFTVDDIYPFVEIVRHPITAYRAVSDTRRNDATGFGVKPTWYLRRPGRSC